MEHEEKFKQSSVEISISAKGAFSGKVKAYAETIDESMILACKKAVELETMIREKNLIVKEVTG